MAERIRMLLVEDSITDAMLIESALRDSELKDTVYDHVRLLSDALTLIRKHPYDLIILDLGLPDSQGEHTLEQLVKEFPDLAVVVFTGSDNKDLGLQAIRAGAQDYLYKSQITNGVLVKSIVYALERHRRISLLKREEQTFERMGLLATNITAEVFTNDRLFESIPTEMEKLVQEYSETLNAALDAMLHNGSEVGERCQRIGERLGFLRASPRDVVEVHRRALGRVIEGSTQEKSNAYAEEGRMVALQVMGYLAGYYRNYSIAPQGKPKGSREHG